jgi:hypothetical protein
LGSLGVILGHLGLSRGYLGAILGPSWGYIGSSCVHLGHLRVILGCLGVFFEVYWGQLGPSWADLRAILGHLGVNLAILRCHLGGFGGCHTRFGGSWLVSEGCPARFEGPGRFLRDVSRGLGGPAGRGIKATRAPRGFDHGLRGLGGRGKPDKITEG